MQFIFYDASSTGRGFLLSSVGNVRWFWLLCVEFDLRVVIVRFFLSFIVLNLKRVHAFLLDAIIIDDLT